MSEELNELYQEILLDHSSSPRNYGTLPSPSATATGTNPYCGDKITIHVDFDGDVISDLRFEGAGCVISQASASVMTELVKGKSKEEARKLAEHFRGQVSAEERKKIEAEESDFSNEPLVCAFSGVSEFPTRVKCATLAWHALCSALEK